MRTISPTLLAAQNFEQTTNGQDGKRWAFAEFIFHGTEEDLDYSDRNKGARFHYDLNSGSGTIVLANEDHLVDWIVGYWIEPKIGDQFFNDDGEKTTYEAYPLPRLWVTSQEDISFPGAKFVRLELTGAQKFLRENDCIIPEVNDVPPYHYENFGNWIDLSYFNIINGCISAAGFGLDVLEESDGIIDIPITNPFYINVHYFNLLERNGTVSEDYKGKYESFSDVIYKALSRTHMYLIAKGGSENAQFKFVYPREDDEPDITYYSYKDPQFKEFIYRKNIVSPNSIITFCNWNNELVNEADEPRPDFDPLITGEANHLPSQANIGKIIKRVWIPEINDQVNADSIAEAYLENEKLKSRGGRLIIPLDMRPEVGDLVEVDDAR